LRRAGLVRFEKEAFGLLDRRTALATFLTAPTLPLLGARFAMAQDGERLELTPACGDDPRPTIAQTEGPYFKPDAPLKRDLAADRPRGERMIVAGLVLDRNCGPVPKALVQIWQADETGAYDNAGFRLRGHQYADDRGRWWFSTIVPAPYPGRTRHIHAKVQRRGGRVLTTQLYFPGEPLNRRDGLFDRRLLMSISEAADGKFGRFDFVV
jgi:protocatechuate 3,4-dioxygenase beta subunit